MVDWQDRRNRWLVLAAIVAVAAFLRFLRLGGQSLWTDEIITIGTYSSPPPGIPYLRKLLWDIHGPLYSVIMHFWSKLSGSEAWLRTPSAVAGVLSVVLMYRWLRAIGRDDLAATGALLLAISPYSLYYSQELRFYAQLTLFAIWSLIVFERFLSKPSAGSGVILGCVLALTCLSHFSALFLCVAFVLYLAVTGRLRGEHLRYGAVAAVIVLAVISPWIYREIYFLRRIPVGNIAAIPVEERFRGDMSLSAWSYPYLLYAFATGYSFGPDLRELHLVTSARELVGAYGVQLGVAAVLFGGLFAYGLARRASRDRLPYFLCIILAGLGTLLVLTLFNIKVFNVRYLTVAFPAFIALLCFGLPSRGVRRYLLLGAVVAVMAVADWNYLMVPRYGRDDVRGAARIVEENEQRGDVIVIMAVGSTFAHYYRGGNAMVPYIRDDVTASTIEDRIRAKADGDARIWHVQCRPWDVDPKGNVQALLTRTAEPEEQWRLTGVTITLFKRPDTVDQ